MHNEINLLAKILKSLNILEYKKVLKIASNLYHSSDLKRFQMPDDEMIDDEIIDEKSWMLYVARDLSEILELHSPAFIGRSKAYAWSASNNEGHPVIMKIIPRVEIDIYKKIMNIKKTHNISILPEIYDVKDFKEIPYNPPHINTGYDGSQSEYSSDYDSDYDSDYHSDYDSDNDNNISSEMTGVVIMEELVKAPEDVVDYILHGILPGDNGAYYNNLRYYFSNNQSLLMIASDISEKIYNYMKNISNNSYESLNIELNNLKSETHNFLYNELKKIKHRYEKNLESDHYIDNVFEKFYNFFINDFLKKSNILNKILESELDKVKKEIKKIFEKTLYDESPSKTPSVFKDRDPTGFAEGMKKIDELNIIPYDLNDDNIMMRPESGEIVISDVGHFAVGDPF